MSLVWPYARRTTYVNGSLPAIDADDLNAMQDETAALAYQYLIETYGDGSDGACVFDGTTPVPGCTLSGGIYTVTRDIQATTILMTSSGLLQTRGFELMAQQSITVDNALLYAQGAAAVGATGGQSASRHCSHGFNGQSAIISITPQYVVCGLGGNGGNGGSNGVNPHNLGIEVLAPISADYKRPPFAYGVIPEISYGVRAPSAAVDIIRGGGGGAAGQGDGSNAGGGGGEAGQLLVLRAPTITIKNGASLDTSGGAGAAGTGGNAGGGGGGGGGAMHFICEQFITSGTAPSYVSTGGGGGAGAGSGTAGNAGNAGNTIPFITKLAA